jgi:hypothetical protein
MTDLTTAAPVDKREAVAKHELIAAPGGEHTGIDVATGIRYTDRASSQVFEYIVPLPKAVLAKGVTIDDFKGSAILMGALFGFKTKATNETSRVRNGAGGDTTAQMEALDEVFESITNGVWREKAEGGGGSRTDKVLLATVLVEMLGAIAKGGVSDYVTRFTDDPAYMRKVLKSDAGDEYKRRAGKTGPAIDSLA